jgi:superfamily II DNA or RNA helicase
MDFQINYNKYINKKGYVIRKSILSIDEQLKIKTDLMVKPFVPKDYVQTEVESFAVYTENKSKFYLPKYYGITHFGQPEHNYLPNGTEINVNFTGTLREEQYEPINACLASFNTTGGGIFCLPCGKGKTTCACYIINQLKQKTLVVVHLGFLINQWKERIEQFLPNARIGILRANIQDIEDKDIVISTIQSLSLKSYPMDIFTSFGLCIIDEAHVTPCRSFSQAFRKGMNCKYMLGLSATPNRTDGLTKVLKWYIGDFVYKGIEDRKYNVEVQRLIYDCNSPEYCTEILNFRRKANMPAMVNQITAYIPRLAMIIKLLMHEFNEGRKILVLCDRREYLEKIKTGLEMIEIISVGFYVGGMKTKDLKITEEQSIILGTYSMASTGMDIPGLNTLCMCTSKTNIQQSVGRILRQKHATIIPRIIDIVDTFSIFISQGKKRLLFYNKMKYNIITNTVNTDGDIINTIVHKTSKQKSTKTPNKEHTTIMTISDEED